MTLNAINTTKPIPQSAGGTGTTSFANLYGTIYEGSSALTTTDPGTSGQLLCSNGAGVAPSMQTKTGATPTFELIQTQTVSSLLTGVTFTQITSTYQTYLVTICNYTCSIAGSALWLLLSTDGGATFPQSGFAANLWQMPYTTTAISTQASTAYFISSGADTALPSFATVWLFNMGVSAYPVMVGTNMLNGTSPYWIKTAGLKTTLGTYNAIQFLNNQTGSATISGTISLYGVRQ